MESNCSIVKIEPSILSSYHHLHTNHRVDSEWPAEYEFMFTKQTETPPSSTGNNTVDTLSDYATCIPVTSNSLDSSTGLNSSCSTLDPNGSTGHQIEQQQQQQQQLSFHTLTHSDQTNGHLNAGQIQSQSQAPMSGVDFLSSSSSSPSIHPLNVLEAEKFKLDRKRERNREAASKCRKRKLEKIQKLEEKVKQVKNQNSELTASIIEYRDKLDLLRQQLMEHVENGCRISPFLQHLLVQK